RGQLQDPSAGRDEDPAGHRDRTGTHRPHGRSSGFAINRDDLMKIAINGACGRMGQAVAKAAADAKVEVAELIDVAKGDGVSRRLTKKVDAVVDFSTPEAALERLAECVKAKTSAVICTTGFTDAQKAEITAASKKIPVLFSSNMSVGVNLLFKRVPEIAKTLG